MRVFEPAASTTPEAPAARPAMRKQRSFAITSSEDSTRGQAVRAGRNQFSSRLVSDSRVHCHGREFDHVMSGSALGRRDWTVLVRASHDSRLQPRRRNGSSPYSATGSRPADDGVAAAEASVPPRSPAPKPEVRYAARAHVHPLVQRRRVQQHFDFGPAAQCGRILAPWKPVQRRHPAGAGSVVAACSEIPLRRKPREFWWSWQSDPK